MFFKSIFINLFVFSGSWRKLSLNRKYHIEPNTSLFKQLRICNAQPLTPCSLITADFVGVLNVQRCNLKNCKIEKKMWMLSNSNVQYKMSSNSQDFSIVPSFQQTKEWRKTRLGISQANPMNVKNTK